MYFLMKQFACNLFFIGDGGPTFFIETGTRLDTDFRDFKKLLHNFCKNTFMKLYLFIFWKFLNFIVW